MHGHVHRDGKRKDGSWRWRARYPDPVKGGTAQIERVFRTKREAEDWLVSEAASKQQGTWINPRQAGRPFSDVIAAWKEGWHRLTPGTRARYESIVNGYLTPEFGNVPIGRITHEVVQRYVDRLDADPRIAAGTVRNVFACLRNAMSKGVRLGLVKVNPCTAIDLPRSPREDMLALTADEVRKLAEVIDPFYKTLIYVAAYCGLRAGELHALRRCDLDLLRGVVHVRRSLRVGAGGELSFGEPKTASSRRTITLPKPIVQMLAAHLAQSPGGPGDLVFPSKTGKPTRHHLFARRHFKPAVKKALPAEKHGLRFHDLRHTCASLGVASGANVKMVQEMLGHSSVTITLDRYSHLFASAHEALADNLAATFVAAEAKEDASNVVAIGK
jgi:integrase